MEEAIGKLIEFIESASPVMWESARTQVISDVVSSLIWAIAALLLAVLFYISGKYAWGVSKESKYDEGSWIVASASAYFLAAITGLIALGPLTSAIKMLINPTYYAIQNLVALWPG